MLVQAASVAQHLTLNLYLVQKYLLCRQDLEIEIDRFEIARGLIAEVSKALSIAPFHMFAYC